MFECELALELGMTLGQLRSAMSVHELSVEWPAFFRARERERKRAEFEAEKKAGKR